MKTLPDAALLGFLTVMNLAVALLIGIRVIPEAQELQKMHGEAAAQERVIAEATEANRKVIQENHDLMIENRQILLDNSKTIREISERIKIVKSQVKEID